MLFQIEFLIKWCICQGSTNFTFNLNLYVMMTSFFILLSSIYSHSVHFQNLLRAEKLFHFKFLIDWYITLTCLSNFNFEVFFQAAIMNYAQYGVMPRCCRWGFLICVSWHLPLTLCKISALYVFFSGLGDFLANSPILFWKCRLLWLPGEEKLSVEIVCNG